MKSIKIALATAIFLLSISLQLISQPPYPEWKQYLPATSLWKMNLEGNTLYTTNNHFGFGLIALDLNTNQTQVFSEYSAGIASDNITAIDVDADGNIWLGHKGHGVTKLSDDLCTIFNMENSGLINDTITTICIDINGKIWIGSWKGICSFDGENWQSYTSINSDLPNDTVSTIVTDEENNKWIGLKGGFVIFDEITWDIHIIFQPPLYIPILQNMTLEENGNAWLDFRHYGSGLFKYDGDTIINMLWPPGPYNYIADLDFDSEGNLWMPIWSGMSDFGLAMYDGIEFTVYDFTEMTDFLSNRNQSIEIDENDNKWIGSLENGLLKFKDGAVEQINEGIFGLRYPRDLAIENDQRIWLANNDGLSEYNSGDWNFYSYYNSEFPGESSGCVAIDKNKKKWIGGENQLITYDDENWYVYDTSNSPIAYGNPQSIDNIVIDNNDTKWFSKKWTL